MSSWFLKEQEEKVGRSLKYTFCKRLRCYPIEKKGQITGFGHFKHTIFQIVISNGVVDHKIQWTNGTKKSPTAKSIGSFNYIYQDKCKPSQEPNPTYKGFANDLLSPNRIVKGKKEIFETHQSIHSFLCECRGEEIADEVMQLFAEQVAQLMSKVA